jgi:hypothetical protein
VLKIQRLVILHKCKRRCQASEYKKDVTLARAVRKSVFNCGRQAHIDLHWRAIPPHQLDIADLPPETSLTLM